MHILVDLDGTIINIHQPWLDMYNADWEDSLQVAQIDRWAMHELVKPACGIGIYEYLTDPRMYALAPMIPGALDCIRELREMGHRITFLSSGFFPDKVKWVSDHGFLMGANQRNDWRFAPDVILAHDKNDVKGDLLVDDSPANFHGRPGILFDQPWNQASTMRRARMWPDVVRLIKYTTFHVGREQA